MYWSSWHDIKNNSSSEWVRFNIALKGLQTYWHVSWIWEASPKWRRSKTSNRMKLTNRVSCWEAKCHNHQWCPYQQILEWLRAATLRPLGRCMTWPDLYYMYQRSHSFIIPFKNITGLHDWETEKKKWLTDQLREIDKWCYTNEATDVYAI